MPQPTQVTAAEISRLAGVTRATVSNWRRRHPDFPAPSGGTEASPAYDLDAVRAWLAARAQLPAPSPVDELRAALRVGASDPAGRSRLLPFVVAAGRITESEAEKASGLGDEPLSAWAGKTSQPYADRIPGVDEVAYRPQDAPLLRVLLRCVAEEGAARTLEVFAESDISDNKASGAYRTPQSIVDLMADLLASPGEPYPRRVFDPACGVGSLLSAAAARGARELSGQDITQWIAAQAAARLAVATEDAKARVEVGDSMRGDAFPALAADAALCVPPFGHREWGHEDLAYDQRWLFGLPPKGEPELAWLQHCVAHLAPGGRAVLLMPPNSAFRPSGRRIRAEMVRSGALRAVVALPVGVAQPLHIGLQLWLLRRPRPQGSAPSTVLLIDSAALSARGAEQGMGRRTASHWPEISAAVLDVWHDFDRHPDGFEPVPGVARAVPVVDLLDEVVDLSPVRHVRAAPVAVKPDEFAAMAHELRSRLRRAASGLVTVSGGQPWLPAGAAPLSWRTASVADLLRGDALTLLRAPLATSGSGLSSGDADAPRMLTVADVVASQPASGVAQMEPSEDDVTIREGDVVIPDLLREGGGVARVADADDAGHLLGRHLFLLRPDPARLDSWFLAGFLSAEDNVSAASSGSTVVRVDPRRLRIPLLSLAEQQRYGRAFRQVDALRQAVDVAKQAAYQAAHALAAGLTGGALLPPEPDPPST